MPPLSLPQQCPYTSCWCEENIYLLCLHFLGDRSAMDDWNIYAVFISNESKTVSMARCICTAINKNEGGIVEAKKGPLTLLACSVGLSCSTAPYISRTRSNRSKRLDIWFWHNPAHALSSSRLCYFQPVTYFHEFNVKNIDYLEQVFVMGIDEQYARQADSNQP